LSADDFALSDWMEPPFLPLLTPRILIVVALVLAVEALLRRTPVGRGFFLVGGNAATAWQAGLPVDRYVTGAFVLSGMFSALGGALFSISLNSATTNMGVSSLMIVVAAVIIGGTSMKGGKGSVFKSMIALIALTMLTNGFSAMGAGFEIQKITGGLVLAGVILYDAWFEKRREEARGRRHELMEELKTRALTTNEEDDMTPPRQDRNLLIICVTALACVAIVAIVAMYNLRLAQTVPQGYSYDGRERFADTASARAQPSADVTQLRSVDGQLLLPPPSTKEILPRPSDPAALPEEDAGHWYDMEYAGWNAEKINLPVSPGDGPRGKTVIYLKMVDHPYLTAIERGMRKVADAHGIQVKTMVANSDINIQAQQVDQAINERADLVIINPVDARASLPLFRRLNRAGIPVIASNTLPSDEAMRYILAWTGPDDWEQFRMLARKFAELMNYEGGYVIVRHFPGGSPYFSRTFSIITELKKIAPEMKLLAMQTTNLEAEQSMQVVSDWISRFGHELKGIVSADDAGAQVGINEAVRGAGREDIVRVAAGNSKVGMEFVQQGRLHGITFQSPEADGALPMQLAADWFSGKEIPPIQYLPRAIIIQDNVEEYLPSQW
jgi:ABC-type sugar transport system substrate-binding protein